MYQLLPPLPPRLVHPYFETPATHGLLQVDSGVDLQHHSYFGAESHPTEGSGIYLLNFMFGLNLFRLVTKTS